jgi:hypothetical protein
MHVFLVGIMFHEPESFALWNQGVIEDYESSTGCYIEAPSVEDALAWGESIGAALLRYLNADDSLDWKGMGYYCWLEDSPETSNWKHCLDHFHRVKQGEMPDFDQMTSEAYRLWEAKRA